MKLKSAHPPYQPLYLPALIIVGTVVVLLLVIAVSTYHNLDREQLRTEVTLQREGRVIVHSLAAALKADFRAAPPDLLRLNRLLADMALDTDIYSLSIVNSAGTVIAAAAPSAESFSASGSSSLTLLLREKGLVTRYRNDAAGERIYEIIQPLHPIVSSLTSSSAAPPILRPTPGSSVNSWVGSGAGRKGPGDLLVAWSQDKIIALSFRLQVFETARQADFSHVILMATILIILATGTLYFMFVVQKYYLVDRKLGQMKSYLENVVDSMADGLISVDNQGRIVTVNNQAAEILSLSTESLPGKHLSDVLGSEIVPLLLAKRDALLRDQVLELQRSPASEHLPVALSAVPLPVTLSVAPLPVTLSVAPLPVTLSVAPLKDELGHDIGQVLLIKDLREIRQLQESVRRSERLASLGRLAAGIAHEIRNPLSSIRGFAQFFEQKFVGGSEEQEYAAIMVREVDRLNRVITELLDFSRPQELRREPCILQKIIEGTVQLVAMELATKKVVLEKDYAADMPLIRADQEQLAQAFLNLLLNALQAVEEGGRIRIELSHYPGHAVIAWADNGGGIPPADREKIFEPFFSSKRHGTGLGLAIVHQIVENHGGEIGVTDRPGGGTVFSIDLPLNITALQGS